MTSIVQTQDRIWVKTQKYSRNCIICLIQIAHRASGASQEEDKFEGRAQEIGVCGVGQKLDARPNHWKAPCLPSFPEHLLRGSLIDQDDDRLEYNFCKCSFDFIVTTYDYDIIV